MHNICSLQLKPHLLHGSHMHTPDGTRGHRQPCVLALNAAHMWSGCRELTALRPACSRAHSSILGPRTHSVPSPPTAACRQPEPALHCATHSTGEGTSITVKCERRRWCRSDPHPWNAFPWIKQPWDCWAGIHSSDTHCVGTEDKNPKGSSATYCSEWGYQGRRSLQTCQDKAGLSGSSDSPLLSAHSSPSPRSTACSCRSPVSCLPPFHQVNWPLPYRGEISARLSAPNRVEQPPKAAGDALVLGRVFNLSQAAGKEQGSVPLIAPHMEVPCLFD